MKSFATVALLSVALFPVCKAVTINIQRKAVDSSFFNDSLPNGGCDFDGEVTFSHPMSFGQKDRYYVLGSQMLEAAHITVDQINLWPRCGLSLDGKNFSVTLSTFGDESSTSKTEEIGKRLVNTTDFLLSGYSSTLTAFLSPVAEDNGMVLVTGGSSSTDVHANRSHVFGILPPSGSFLYYAFGGLQSKGAKTVATIAEEDVGSCDGAPEMADQFGMEFLGKVTLPEFAEQEIYDEVARNFSQMDPDVVIACTRTVLGHWNTAQRKVNWYPKAQVYTIVVGSPEFEESLGTDLPYVMGVSSWDRALPPIPCGATGWTPREFDATFEEMAFRRPAYQHTSQSSAVSVLAQAIERVGTLNLDRQTLQDRVRNVIKTGYFATVYGNVSFDENGQSAVPNLLLQYDSNNTLHVLLPEDRSFTDFEIMYPMPSWDNRDCISLSICNSTNGTCTSEGRCECESPLLSTGLGASATCESPPEETDEGHDYGIVVAIPVVVAMVVMMICFAFYFLRMKGRNDAVWQVQKSELKFSDPAEVIGRGSFGLVLLAEYRGTQVAVKRVLPPNKRKKNKKDYGNTSNLSFDVDEEADGEREKAGMKSGSSFGTSSLVSDTNNTNAGKSRIMSSAGTYRKLKQDFYKEMRYLSKLRHPCVTTVMGAVISPTEEPMLIMEFMDHGSLHDILHNQTMIIEAEIMIPMLRDITQGCRFLHSANPQVIHGDLKSANILVDSRFRAKVADFGLSNNKQQRGATGTPFWMAPELLRKESLNTTASDVYSFGIIMYEVYARKDPYEDEEDAKEVLRQVADSHINKRPPVPKDCPPQMESLMCDCLVANPDERPSFEELDKRIKRVDVKSLEIPDQKSSHFGRDRTTVSLFDIFPKHIAEALRDGKQVEAEHKDSVTIFFSDIVGFTTISSTLEPRKVANMLDRLYQRFDDLSHKHDVFKVETIGDAYMAVTNLVKDQPLDHAKRIADFAVEAIEAAKETMIDTDDPDKGYVNIRVGFHSGPVVADVVGSRNPRYCLFGDSVNTASRMESNSKQNMIHCSQASADLLKQQKCSHSITSRGMIEVKGKGEMHTYWVGSELAETAP